MPARPHASRREKSTPKSGLGRLPEWNLTDLYAGIDDPLVERDLDRADAESLAFEQDYKGKLATLADAPDGGGRARRGGQALRVTRRPARPADLLCRPDPCRQHRRSRAGQILCATSRSALPRPPPICCSSCSSSTAVDDRSLEAAMQDPALGHYRPWLEDIRKDKPYQLEDRVEQLFHEKSVTAYSAWNRLFDETIAELRFKVGTRSLAIEPTLNLLQDPREKMRKAAAQALAADLQEGPADLCADHEHSRQGQGNIRPLARLCRRCRRAPPVESGRARGGGRRWSRRCAPPIRGCRTAIMRSRPAGSARSGCRIGTATRRCRKSRPARSAGARRSSTVLAAYGAFSPRWRRSPSGSSRNNWIDAPVRPGKSPGAFSHPTVPSAHPYVLLNYQGKPRDVMTLAHELGHGVHQVLAAPNGALMAPTPLTLAETASVFGEMLTFRKLLARRRPQAAQGHARRPRSRT